MIQLNRLILALSLAAPLALTSSAHGQEADSSVPEIDPEPPTFLRGDINGDSTVNLSDTAAFIGAISATYVPPCVAALDYDESGRINMADLIGPVYWLFAGGSPPAGAFPSCELLDPVSAFSCEESTCVR